MSNSLSNLSEFILSLLRTDKVSKLLKWDGPTLVGVNDLEDLAKFFMQDENPVVVEHCMQLVYLNSAWVVEVIVVEDLVYLFKLL